MSVDGVRGALDRLGVQDSTLDVRMREDIAAVLGLVSEMTLRLPQVEHELETLRARDRKLGLDGTRYHVDSACGACDGVLETSRDAICEKCTGELRRDTAEQDKLMLRESHDVVCAVHQMFEELAPAGKLIHVRAKVDTLARKLASYLLLPHHAFDGVDSCETCGNASICQDGAS
jgi:hypothetical protein